MTTGSGTTRDHLRRQVVNNVNAAIVGELRQALKVHNVVGGEATV